MKNQILLIAFYLSLSMFTYTQVTVSPSVSTTNAPQILSIAVDSKKTTIYLNYIENRGNWIEPWIRVSSSTIIRDRLTGLVYDIKELGDGLKLDNRYATKKGDLYVLTLVFPALPPGTNSIDILENVADGWYWKDVKINNPNIELTSEWNEVSIKVDWAKNGINTNEGIYESIDSENGNIKYTLALKMNGEKYELIYLGGNDNGKWKIGDIKAILNKTATPNIYKVKWYMSDKIINEDLYITFESGMMKIISTNSQPTLYLKLFPTSSASSAKSSGTGFAISSDGYIVTNYHVVDGANKISVRGVKGNFSKVYSASIVIEDKNNDLAIIKIDDKDLTTLGIIPYSIVSNISDVGNSVYTLGYPLRSTMGDEIKLTNGIISSKTGFQGDITTYQISVPLQPGNSGGPLLNSKGEIIGIVNAKHSEAENASYAIKSCYLTNLIQVMNTPLSLPKKNIICTKTLSEQVKYVKEYVYILEVN